MQTKFVEIDLPRSQLPNGQAIPAAIEKLLQAWGEPLRWSITHVDVDSLHIEAILTEVDSEVGGFTESSASG
jgi:hypothetical protein